jgi:DNA-binding MarR family transcriptional regulator
MIKRGKNMTPKQHVEKKPDRIAFFDDIDFNIWVLLDRANYVISRSRDLELAQFDLTQEQASILKILIDKGGSATNDELIQSTMRQSLSVNFLIARMTKRGLVKKENSSKKNKYLVSITSYGKEIYKEVTYNSLIIGFSDLSKEEKKNMDLYLNKIVSRGRNMLGLDFKFPFLTHHKEIIKDHSK